MTFALPELPYAKDALLPHMSPQTLKYHHEKHHRSYIEKLNAALDSIDYAGGDMLEVVRNARENGDEDVFNNAAQAWNHSFFWQSMSPGTTRINDNALARKIEEFGGIKDLRSAFMEAGAGQFGSGWVWVVQTRDGKLDVMSTPNADPPQIYDLDPLLTCDVWEHAYYLDYQNAREDFLEAFFDELVNWEFAAEQIQRLRDQK